MKSHYLKITPKALSTFTIRRITDHQEGRKMHYHHELELHLVKSGCGVRLVGNCEQPIQAGDLILLGPDVPHCWEFRKPSGNVDKATAMDVIILQFASDCLGRQFLQLPEASSLARLLCKSARGLLFRGSVCKEISDLLLQLLEKSAIDGLIIFLKILHLLAENDSRPIIEVPYACSASNHLQQKKINKIYEYTLKNYHQRIDLKQASLESNLTVTSFCRFFRSMTKKTYINFLNETRIHASCKLLLDKSMKIEVITKSCGFDNLTSFYRHFKRVIGMTPSSYRRKLHSGRDLT